MTTKDYIKILELMHNIKYYDILCKNPLIHSIVTISLKNNILSNTQLIKLKDACYKKLMYFIAIIENGIKAKKSKYDINTYKDITIFGNNKKQCVIKCGNSEVIIGDSMIYVDYEAFMSSEIFDKFIEFDIEPKDIVLRYYDKDEIIFNYIRFTGNYVEMWKNKDTIIPIWIQQSTFYIAHYMIFIYKKGTKLYILNLKTKSSHTVRIDKSIKDSYNCGIKNYVSYNNIVICPRSTIIDSKNHYTVNTIMILWFSMRKVGIPKPIIKIITSMIADNVSLLITMIDGDPIEI